jgi:hypothetical protein
MDDLNTAVAPETAPSPPGDGALGALAKSDDATRYIEERQSQEAEDLGQEPEHPANGRADRIEQSLEQGKALSNRLRLGRSKSTFKPA